MATKTAQKNIPNQWEMKTLGSVGILTMGQSPKGSSYNTEKAGMPLLNGAVDLKKDRIKINQYTTAPVRTSKEGDLLFCIRATIGNLQISDRVYCLGRGVASMRVGENYDRGFIAQQLEDLFILMRQRSQGGVIKGLTKDELAGFEILVPKSKTEQQNIAQILGTVDEEIQKTDEIISATEKLKRGLMQRLFTRGIGHTKFKKTEIGEIPAEWGLSKLKDVAKFTNGKAHEKNIKEDGKYIVINSKFISTNGGVTKRSDKNLSPLFAKDIAMVMSDIPKGKALAKCFLVEENDKYTLNQRICSLRATKMVDKFLYYILNRNPYFLGFDNGVGQTNLRKDEVLGCPVQVPHEGEQREIVELLSSVDEKISVNRKLKAKLTTLKKGLMQDLLSGKVRVPTT